jgi:hypothetical protein
MDAQYIDVKRVWTYRMSYLVKKSGKIMNLAFESGFHDKRVQMFAGDQTSDVLGCETRTPHLAANTKVCETHLPRSAWWIQQHLESPAPAIMNRWAWTLHGISKYEAGQSFRWHSDSVYGTSDDNLGFQTLLLYLNDDFRGGETCFRVWEDVEDATIVSCTWTGSAPHIRPRTRTSGESDSRRSVWK